MVNQQQVCSFLDACAGWELEKKLRFTVSFFRFVPYRRSKEW